MASSRLFTQQAITDSYTVTCDKHCDIKPIKVFLQRLYQLPMRTLNLVGFDRYDDSNFFAGSFHFISLVQKHIHGHQTLSTLILDKPFTQAFKAQRHFSDSSTFNLNVLTTLPVLTHLVLDNDQWHENFFQSLQGYLEHNKCNLIKLTLLQPITATELEALKKTFRTTPSLREYEGPFQEELQLVLDAKNMIFMPV